jgi:hypothetical protein
MEQEGVSRASPHSRKGIKYQGSFQSLTAVLEGMVCDRIALFDSGWEYGENKKLTCNCY